MPQAYRVIILPRAFDDLERIIDYIKRDSPQNAARTLTRLYEAARSLHLFPHRYEVHERRRDPDKTVHSMAVPPYIIYYRILEAHKTVRVLTIRHGARRQPRRFK